MLTFSSKNLSEDCTQVAPGGEVRSVKIEATAALLRLSNGSGPFTAGLGMRGVAGRRP